MLNNNLLTAAALAERLGFKRQTIYNRLSLGGDLPPPVYLGRVPRWRPEDIEAWLTTKAKSFLSTNVMPMQPKRRVGRPTKAEEIAQRRLGN